MPKVEPSAEEKAAQPSAVRARPCRAQRVPSISVGRARSGAGNVEEDRGDRSHERRAADQSAEGQHDRQRLPCQRERDRKRHQRHAAHAGQERDDHREQRARNGYRMFGHEKTSRRPSQAARKIDLHMSAAGRLQCATDGIEQRGEDRSTRRERSRSASAPARRRAGRAATAPSSGLTKFSCTALLEAGGQALAPIAGGAADAHGRMPMSSMQRVALIVAAASRRRPDRRAVGTPASDGCGSVSTVADLQNGTELAGLEQIGDRLEVETHYRSTSPRTAASAADREPSKPATIVIGTSRIEALTVRLDEVDAADFADAGHERLRAVRTQSHRPACGILDVRRRWPRRASFARRGRG